MPVSRIRCQPTVFWKDCRTLRPADCSRPRRRFWKFGDSGGAGRHDHDARCIGVGGRHRRQRGRFRSQLRGIVISFCERSIRSPDAEEPPLSGGRRRREGQAACRKPYGNACAISISDPDVGCLQFHHSLPSRHGNPAPLPRCRPTRAEIPRQRSDGRGHTFRRRVFVPWRPCFQTPHSPAGRECQTVWRGWLSCVECPRQFPGSRCRKRCGFSDLDTVCPRRLETDAKGSPGRPFGFWFWRPAFPRAPESPISARRWGGWREAALFQQFLEAAAADRVSRSTDKETLPGRRKAAEWASDQDAFPGPEGRFTYGKSRTGACRKKSTGRANWSMTARHDPRILLRNVETSAVSFGNYIDGLDLVNQLAESGPQDQLNRAVPGPKTRKTPETGPAAAFAIW